MRSEIPLRLRTSAQFLLGLAIILLGVDMIWIVFFGGVRLELGDYVLRSTTIEFPAIAFTVSAFGFLLLRNQWKESLLLAGSIIFTCIIGEGMLRLVDHPLSEPFIDANAWQEPSDIVGFTMAPNFEGRGPLDVFVKTNSEGFRDDGPHSLAKPSGVTRILGVGDSFTFGWGVSLEESFLERLERKLEAKTDRKVESINSGVPGWNLNHYYVYYKEIGVRYSPDIVLLSYFWNDIPYSIQETIPPDPRHEKGYTHRGGIFYASYLFNFVKSQAHLIRIKNSYKRIDYLYALKPRREKLAKIENALLFDSRKNNQQKFVNILRTLLQKIHRLANRHGCHLIIVMIPDVAQLHHPEMQHINRLLAAINDELGIPFIDMTPIFETDLEPTTFYFWPRDFHVNPYGHEKIAERLTPVICQVLNTKC